MFVAGKYVPKTHPLYKAGNYKTFAEAAFASLNNYTKSTEGSVYILVNPAWPNWVKVGMAVDPYDRCRSYQTSSPYRDFQVICTLSTQDRRQTERDAHSLIGTEAEAVRGEWFKINSDTAIDLLATL